MRTRPCGNACWPSHRSINRDTAFGGVCWRWTLTKRPPSLDREPQAYGAARPVQRNEELSAEVGRARQSPGATSRTG